MSTRRNDLAQRRRSQGLSQEALAAKLGVDAKTIRRWESGETTNGPQPCHRPTLARSLDVEPAQLEALLSPTAEPEQSAGPTQPADEVWALSSDRIPRRNVHPVDELEPWELLDVLTRSSLSPGTLREMRTAALGYATFIPAHHRTS
jgi:transcriptional regulator with XRE-family HTH domain